jgi:hypothetical protein
MGGYLAGLEKKYGYPVIYGQALKVRCRETPVIQHNESLHILLARAQSCLTHFPLCRRPNFSQGLFLVRILQVSTCQLFPIRGVFCNVTPFEVSFGNLESTSRLMIP